MAGRVNMARMGVYMCCLEPLVVMRNYDLLVVESQMVDMHYFHFHSCLMDRLD